jgi:hypothetical protein
MSVMRMGVILLAAALAGAAGAEAQWAQVGDGWCEGRWRGDDERSCMTLQAEFASPGRVVVDGGANGGVDVQGWNRDAVEVRARVWANAGSEERARELAEEVRLSWRDGRLRADGPETGRRESWGVSWDVRVPRDTDLEIETHNGGISVDGVRGEIDFRALNGGVHLTGVAGDVSGRTTNGGVTVELDGRRWEGTGMDVETTNGGVTLAVPADYSARLETGTVNGGIELDFPVTVQGRLGKRLATTLGEGGATVRAVTTNGGVRIVRSEGAVR